MKQVGVDVNAEIARNEDSLLRLIQGFEQYKLQVTQAYDYAQAMLMRGAHGFSSPEKAALHEEELSHAIQAYFRLRDQIGWWLEQVRQIDAARTEIERQASSTGGPNLPGSTVRGRLHAGLKKSR